MVRSKKIAGLVLAAGLATGGLTASTAGAASASPSTCGGSGTVTTTNGTLADGATYLIECPAGPWNGTLYLYSHGYVRPGDPNPAAGRRRPGYPPLDARPRLRARGLVLRQHRLGHRGRAARPDRHAEHLRRPLRQAQDDGRLGALAGRHHHRRADPGLPEPVQRRAAHVRRAVRRRGHLEHRARRRVRVPEADRPRGPDRQHHQPRGQPAGRRDRGSPGPGDPAGPGPPRPGLGAGRHPRLVRPVDRPNPPPTTTPPRRRTSSCGVRR